jgi:hypothetical protein
LAAARGQLGGSEAAAQAKAAAKAAASLERKVLERAVDDQRRAAAQAQVRGSFVEVLFGRK